MNDVSAKWGGFRVRSWCNEARGKGSDDLISECIECIS